MTGSAKTLLLLILLMPILIPARAANSADPRQGLRKALRQIAWFNIAYVFALLFIWPRLL